MTRFYISSSYEDLKEERRAAGDVLNSRGHKFSGMEQYRASPTPPLELCIRDVESCTHYLGIFAFRYGFCPNGGSKSITQLEYEAAINKGIPPYIFLLQEKAPWPVERTDKDRTAIDRFRAYLAEKHTVKFFASKDELIGFLKDVVDVVPPSSRQIDPMLPGLCNRGPQRNELTNAIKATADKKTRPIILTVHGDDEQEHDSFRERLTGNLLREELKSGEVRPVVKSYHIPWPARVTSDSLFRIPYLRDAADKILRSRNVTLEQFCDALAQFPAPVVFYSYFRGSGPGGAEPEGLEAFRNFWKSCPDFPPEGQRVFALLFIQYPRPGNSWLDRLRDRNAAIKRALTKVSGPDDATPSWVLPPLDDVSLAEAEDWARSDEVSCKFDSAGLIDGIQTFYRLRFGRDYEAGKVPMKTLTAQLGRLLESNAATAERNE